MGLTHTSSADLFLVVPFLVFSLLVFPLRALFLTILVFLTGFFSPGLKTLSGKSQLQAMSEFHVKGHGQDLILSSMQNSDAMQIVIIQVPGLADIVELLTSP